MKCIVINLERATERRGLVTHEFDSRGVEFEFSTAKDRLDLSELDYENFVDWESKLMNWNTSAVPGEIACWISHQQVWRACLKDENINIVAIFEDDAVLTEKISLALNVLESASTCSLFDIVFLENRFPKSVLKPMVDIGHGFDLGLVKFRNNGSAGYVITRSAMRQLIEEFPRMTAHVDVILHASYLTKLQTYTLSPSVVYHRPDPHSFIQTSDRARTESAFRIVRDRLYFKIRKRWMFRIPERVEYYRRVRGTQKTMKGNSNWPPN